MPNLMGCYSDYCKEIDKLIDLEANTTSLNPKLRKLMAEIVMLRSFYLLENIIRSLSVKIACGASYVDGTRPALLQKSSNEAAALHSMKNLGRTKQKWNLKWTTVSEIKDNLKYTLGLTEHFIIVLDRNGTLIDEMRRVRNRIAHNNNKSRTDFQIIVRRHYGAFLNSITPGILLITPRNNPPMIRQYLATSKILIKQLIKG